MPTANPRIDRSANTAFAPRVWRELGQLALEGAAIGVVFSILLAAAVYVVARNAHDDVLNTTHYSPAAQAASAPAA